jgi:hypothetical protein
MGEVEHFERTVTAGAYAVPAKRVESWAGMRGWLAGTPRCQLARKAMACRAEFLRAHCNDR